MISLRAGVRSYQVMVIQHQLPQPTRNWQGCGGGGGGGGGGVEGGVTYTTPSNPIISQSVQITGVASFQG